MIYVSVGLAMLGFYYQHNTLVCISSGIFFGMATAYYTMRRYEP